MADLIDRQAAIDAVNRGCQEFRGIFAECEKNLNELPSTQPEPSTEIQEILDYLDTTLHPIVSPDNWNVYAELHDMVSMLPSVQPELQWHKCDPDDPSSFPDDDRPVLVSFSDSPIPAVGWFERDYDFCGWTDGELFGLHADGWWELPKKPERRTDGSD